MERERAIEIRIAIETARKEMLDRYSVVKAAMRGAFHSALFQGALPNPNAQRLLDRELKRTAQSAIATETRSVVSEATKLLKLAQTNVEFEDVAQRISDFQKSISAQIGHDARIASELFRKTQLRLQSSVVPREETYQQSIAAINDESVFSYRDSIGRTWLSRHYMITLSGKFYYELANDLSLAQVMSEGKTTITLDRPGHESDGLEFSLADLSEVRKQYLHPGSKGIVV